MQHFELAKLATRIIRFGIVSGQFEDDSISCNSQDSKTLLLLLLCRKERMLHMFDRERQEQKQKDLKKQEKKQREHDEWLMKQRVGNQPISCPPLSQTLLCATPLHCISQAKYSRIQKKKTTLIADTTTSLLSPLPKVPGLNSEPHGMLGSC